MTPAQVVYGALAADAGVAALVGARIYPRKLPQGPTYPAITYQQISRVPIADGTVELRQARIQVNCWGAHAEQAEQLADAVEAAMRGYRQRSSGVLVVQDINRLDDDDEETRSWRVMVDLLVTFVN